MSRVSRKSELSPSGTSRPNSIDLGKDSSVDMGSKSGPTTSVTSGGIGVTQEVANISGVTVTGGVSVEISPVDFGITFDPSGTVSIATGAEIPGGLLGISGGIEVDLNTGEVTGGSIGGEVLGLGISVSNSKEGGLGIEFSVQIPFTPIEISLGFGSLPKKPKKPTSTSTPTRPGLPLFPIGELPINPKCTYEFIVLLQSGYREMFDNVGVVNHPNADGWSRQEVYFGENRGYIKSITIAANNSSTVILGGTEDIHDFPRYFREDYTSYGRNVSTGEYFLRYSWPWYVTWHTSRGGVALIYPRFISCPTGETPPPPPPPPPPQPFPNPPPRKRNKMDECCKENLKFLRAIYKGLGIAKFPGRLPSTIIQEVPKEGEQPAEPPQVPIADFVDLLDWQFRRDDERWGQWEIQIDVKDADLTKKGDQGKSIKFPNLAESIAELEGQMLSVTSNVDALVAITTKILVESGMARQEAIKGYLAAKAIIKYMAFKSTEIDVPVPMTFTPGAETISALIQESEGHIKATDYVEKETLRDILLDLLQAAAVTRAVHWQKIDFKTDTKSQLLNLLKGTVDLSGLITNPKKSTDGEEKKFDPAQNFEDFIDSVEDGFRNTTGITDIQNPYGKTPDRRPRIRQIGDNISQAGGDN